MVASMLGSEAIAPGFVAQLERVSEGNPFFVERLLEHLVEDGTLQHDGRGWSTDVALDLDGLPRNVRALLVRKLESLSADALAIARAAAVLGRDFDLDLLVRVVALPEERFFEAMAELRQAAVLLQDEAGRYAFAQDAVQAHLVEALPEAAAGGVAVLNADDPLVKAMAARTKARVVLFGEATAYPHGVNYEQALQLGDVVLIDTGCKVHDYISDITRTYVFGEPTERQRAVWNAEKAAQQAAFDAAQLGVPCREVDAAARRSLEAAGFGPGYKLPGLPHRTGHGIGMDIHEWPYLVGSDDTPLDVGMCFSNEPMICISGEFGIRHEDHFYMTEQGPRWFTEPSPSIDQPFR